MCHVQFLQSPKTSDTPLMGMGKRYGHNRGTLRRLGTIVPERCVGCNRSQGVEASAMVMGGLGLAMEVLVALEESAPAPVHHRCKMARGHLRRRFRCKFHNLQQT